MKTKLTATIFCILALIQMVKAQDLIEHSICSGASVELEVTAIYPNSAFEWSKLVQGVYAPLSENTEKISIQAREVFEKITDQYRCIYLFDGTAYDTTVFYVTYNPVQKIIIEASNLCQGQIAEFGFSPNDDIVEQIWQINNKESFIKKPSHLCESDDDINVTLTVTNRAGCVSVVDTVFNTATDLGAIINKYEHESYPFNNNIECGNSISKFSFEAIDSNAKLNFWRIQTGDKIFDYYPDKTHPGNDLVEKINLSENMIEIEWKETSTSYDINLVVFYSNGECMYETSYSTILLDENAPEKMDLHQKPNSKVLILPEGQFRTDLVFEWGIENDYYNNSNDRFFQEFEQIDSDKTYWVETTFKTGHYCKTRNSISGLAAVQSLNVILTLLPNPTKNWLNIKLESASEGQIFITDFNGITKKSFLVRNENEFRIFMGDLQPGNYVVTFQDVNGNKIKTERVVVQ